MSLDTSRSGPEPYFDDESTDAASAGTDVPGTGTAGAPGTGPPVGDRTTGHHTGGVTPVPPRRHPQASQAQRRRMWVVGAVILGAIGFLVFKGLTSAIVFFKTANEAVAQRAQLGNADFQMEGTVSAGSVHHLSGDIYRFAVVSGGVTVDVENSGDPPQMFRPGLPVVVVGHFVGSSDLFASDEIMVKHSAAYIAAHPSRVRSSSGSSP